MVMPGNKGLCDSFAVFDDFIKAVNNARRNARDLLTDTQLEKLDESMAGEATQDWRYVYKYCNVGSFYNMKPP